jgi:hypothetical protein
LAREDRTDESNPNIPNPPLGLSSDISTAYLSILNVTLILIAPSITVSKYILF